MNKYPTKFHERKFKLKDMYQLINKEKDQNHLFLTVDWINNDNLNKIKEPVVLLNLLSSNYLKDNEI